MSNYIDLYFEDELGTNQIDWYTYNAIKDLGLVYTPYNRIVLAETQNTYHEQAHIFKSNAVNSYSFSDPKNAEKIQNFLDNNIYNNFGVQITFEKYLMTQLYYDALYYCFNDEIVKFGGKEIIKIIPISPKYLYCNKKKDKFYQIIPDYNFKDQFKLDPQSPENQIDFSNNANLFTIFSKDNKDKNQIAEFINICTRSDYYPNIPYLEAMKSMKTNRFIGNYDQKWLTEGNNFKNVLSLYGLDPANPSHKTIVNEWKEKLNNNRSSAGEILVMPIPPTNASEVKFENPRQNKKEDFSRNLELNRDEILAANGLNPTIVGIKTSESSLTSTSQNEALKLYKETQLNNKIRQVEAHYERIFKVIDPNFDSKLILHTFEIEDEEKNVNIETKKIDNEIKFINLGDLDKYNEYLKSINKKEVTPEQFKNLRDNYNYSSLPFSE